MPSSKEEIRSVLAGWALRDNGGCAPLCGAPSGSHSAAPHTTVTLSKDLPTQQEALDAGPIDEPLHRGLILSSLHELQPLLTKTRAP